MAARSTGWAMLAAGSPQESHDLAAIAHASTLEARLPFVHFFDGFRTSHEIQKIELLDDEDLLGMIPAGPIEAHRARALDPEEPVLRGTAQNPDVYFQGRESVNRFYAAAPAVVAGIMERFAAMTGRRYRLFDYVGAPDAERVLVLMGSGAEVAQEAVEALVARGEKVGLVKVRLFRPFSVAHLAKALPASARRIAVLDRTKEPGSAGEPLYQDVCTALAESGRLAAGLQVVGGRFGLGSKEFTPAMAKAVLDELGAPAPRNRFTVGIVDDVTGTSLAWDSDFVTEAPDVFRALFFGLGSDGTVGANKNSIKIIGEETDFETQGYFVYDSKKAGATTVSHLRFGSGKIRSSYLIERARFVACHQPGFLDRQDLAARLEPGGVFLLNTPVPPGQVFASLPHLTQQRLIETGATLWVIDADRVASEAGMAGRINTVMQAAFFGISGVLPREEAIAKIKEAARKTYWSKGEKILQQNFAAIDRALAALHRVPLPAEAGAGRELAPPVPESAPPFVVDVTGALLAGRGDHLPVSAIPCDGTWPTGTSRYTKLRLADELPVWDEELCIQCGKCALVCPHAAIRIKAYEPGLVAGAPETFKRAPRRGDDLPGEHLLTIQVAPEDCTGCGICVDICPAKDKREVRHKALDMAPASPLLGPERKNFEFFLDLPEVDRREVDPSTVKGSQLLQPLFEFSGACAGCGETPYLKLLSQLFGERLVVANATGCSSIYGGNLPTTPWSKNREGRGPAWANSLFEDNAEFGLGFRLSIDARRDEARGLLLAIRDRLSAGLADSILASAEADEAEIHEQRTRIDELERELEALAQDDMVRRLRALATYLRRKSVWIVGGDGWAYDIGFGGLDHVLASGKNVKLLVLDTEVYSNTGGQSSKATPRGAVAKFSAGGKPSRKKDLGLIAMSYGNVYVAQIAMGAKDSHTIRAFMEAEAYPGPALIIAYSHCIAHGIDMRTAMRVDQKAAVDSGHWPLYRYHPEGRDRPEGPFKLDSGKPRIPISQYMALEGRYRILERTHPEVAKELARLAQRDADERHETYSRLARQASPAGTEKSGGIDV